MSVRSIVLASMLFLLVLTSRAESPASSPARGDRAPLSRLSAFEGTILGVVEGVTEFLPISSTGHLIIVTSFLHLDSEQPLFDRAGEPLWYRKPEPGVPGELLTVSLATQAYIVVIQFGAFAAIIPICWSQLMAMGRGLL